MDEIDAYTEKTEDVLRGAHDAGHTVTVHQLERWQGKGLIPRPRQKGLGQGLGTQTLYPIGTAQQVLALCKIASKYRKASRRGWELWWQGFPVDDMYWRPLLIEVADMLDRRIDWLRDADGGISDDGFETIEALAVGPLGWRGIRQIRKRVSIKYFQAFMNILARVAIGDFDGISSDGDDQQIDRGILHKAFGEPETYEGALKTIARNLPGNWSAEFTAMSNAEIFAWRNALRETLSSFCASGSPRFDEKSIAIHTLGALFLDIPRNQATLLIMLISLKNTMFFIV